ncbi:MAG: PAS domain S-box-containing protein, partial [Planctomycetota bacterium]
MTEEDLDSTCVKHTSYGVSLRDFLIVVATLVLGCSLSVSAYFLLDRQEKERLRFQFEHGAEHYAKAIQLEITLNIEALQRIQAVFSSGRQLDRGEFTAIVKYDLKRYPGIHGLGWAKVVKDEEVETFEQKRREEGLPDFYIGMLAADGNKVRVPKRSEYVPMVYLEPGPDGNETRIFGIDLLSEDKRASAIRSARDSGVARALRPNLARFGTNAETDFLIYLPVYQSGSFPETIEERRESLVGFAIANYYVKELIEVALREVTAITELDVFVFDTTDASDEIFLNSYSSSQSEAQVNPRISDLTSGLYWQEQINVAGRTWSIIVRPVTGYIGAKQSWQSILTLFSGIIISTLIATSLFISLRRSREKGQLLSILEQSHISLGKSEEQFRTLFESSRDALMLLNAEARVVDGNSAALKMFGYESVDELISEEVSDRSPRLQPNGLESKTLSNKMTYDVLTHGSSFSEWVYRRRDGTEFPAEVQLSRMELEGRPYFQAIIRDITERKQVEDALNDSEAKYRTLFEQSADAILIIEGDRFIDCNTATVKMLGYTSKKELLVTHPSELSPDMQSDGRNSFEKANEMISTALDQGSHRFEWDHKRRNGKVFPVEVLLTAIPIGERNFLHVVWRDITERKRTDEALRKNEKRLRDAQRIAKMGFWEVDINAATTFWSDEIYAIFGVKPDAFKPNSSSITELIHADDREYVRMAIEASLHDDIPFNIDYRILRPDGDIRYIHTQGEVIRNEAGAPLRRLGTLIDISERKQTEEALLKNHQLLSSVIEAPLDMIYVKDVDGRFLVANTALAKLLGKVKEEIIGKTNADLFPPDAADRADLEDRQVLLTGKPHTYEHTMKMDGQLRTRLSEKTVFRDHEGKILGLVGISRDITERKETEAALVKSQQLYAAAEELGRIGHWEWDYITDRLVDCSAEYARIHDLTREEMLTR